MNAPNKIESGHPNYGMTTDATGGVVTGQSDNTSLYFRRKNVYFYFFSPPYYTSIIPYIDSGVNTPKSPPAGGERLGCAPLIHQLVKHLRRQKRTKPEATSGITMVMSEVPKFQVGGAE